MALLIFIIWFVWERLAGRLIQEPPLKIILIVSDVVALILIIIVAFGLAPMHFAGT